MNPFPLRFCAADHLGTLGISDTTTGTEFSATCSCGWTGHTVTTARVLESKNTPPGTFRGTRKDALRELAQHVAYDRAAHLSELDAAIANLQLAEAHGATASIHAAHVVVKLQNEVETASF
jgi:hypothetical protein